MQRKRIGLACITCLLLSDALLVGQGVPDSFKPQRPLSTASEGFSDRQTQVILLKQLRNFLASDQQQPTAAPIAAEDFAKIADLYRQWQAFSDTTGELPSAGLPVDLLERALADPVTREHARRFAEQYLRGQARTGPVGTGPTRTGPTRTGPTRTGPTASNRSATGQPRTRQARSSSGRSAQNPATRARSNLPPVAVSPGNPMPRDQKQTADVSPSQGNFAPGNSSPTSNSARLDPRPYVKQRPQDSADGIRHLLRKLAEESNSHSQAGQSAGKSDSHSRGRRQRTPELQVERPDVGPDPKLREPAKLLERAKKTFGTVVEKWSALQKLAHEQGANPGTNRLSHSNSRTSPSPAHRAAPSDAEQERSSSSSTSPSRGSRVADNPPRRRSTEQQSPRLSRSPVAKSRNTARSRPPAPNQSPTRRARPASSGKSLQPSRADIARAPHASPPSRAAAERERANKRTKNTSKIDEKKSAGADPDISSYAARHGLGPALLRIVRRTVEEQKTRGTAKNWSSRSDSPEMFRALNKRLADWNPRAGARRAAPKKSGGQPTAGSARPSRPKSSQWKSLVSDAWKAAATGPRDRNTGLGKPVAASAKRPLVPEWSTGASLLLGLALAFVTLLYLGRGKIQAVASVRRERMAFANALPLAELQNRADVIRAFHALASREPWSAAEWWTHTYVGRRLAESVPHLGAAIRELTATYEYARYLPPEAELSREQLKRVNDALRQCHLGIL